MVREVRVEDAAALWEICASALGHVTTVARLRQRIGDLSGDGHYYIAVYEDAAGGALGFIQAERYNLLYGENGWNVIALAVLPSAQGRGIGKALLESLEARARSMGYSFIRLNSNVTREQAHGFYLHQGYVCDKTQKRFYANLNLKVD